MVNNSEAARRTRQRQDTAQKLQFEAQIAPKMRGFYRRVTDDFVLLYSDLGLMIDFNLYLDELTDILRTHYRKVSTVFGRKVRAQLKSASLVLDQKQGESLINQALRAFVNSQPVRSAQTIMTSLAAKFRELTQKVITSTTEALNNSGIAQEVARRFRVQIPGRANTVALSETQLAAEAAKNIEVQTMADNDITVNDTEVTRATVKEWNAVLDSKTRDAHVTADGQRRPIDDPYIVSGQRLMYPGDRSLGASASNVINCRCGSQFLIDAVTLSAEQVDTRRRDFSGNSPVII